MASMLDCPASSKLQKQLMIKYQRTSSSNAVGGCRKFLAVGDFGAGREKESRVSEVVRRRVERVGGCRIATLGITSEWKRKLTRGGRR
jgi:hypothetical protein